MLVVSFSIGFSARLCHGKRYRKYLPFMVRCIRSSLHGLSFIYTSLFAGWREPTDQLCWILPSLLFGQHPICRMLRQVRRARKGVSLGKTVSVQYVTRVLLPCAGNHCRTYRCGAKASWTILRKYLYKCEEHSHHFHNLNYSAGGRIRVNLINFFHVRTICACVLQAVMVEGAAGNTLHWWRSSALSSATMSRSSHSVYRPSLKSEDGSAYAFHHKFAVLPCKLSTYWCSSYGIC